MEKLIFLANMLQMNLLDKSLTPLLLLTSLIMIGMGCEEGAVDDAQQAPDRPNIVFILADDLGYGDLSLHGQDKFSTPNLDAMAAAGMVLTAHYSGSTVCAPSRSALMTGLHTGHTPVRGNKEVQPEGQWPMPDDTYTLPEFLKEQGYVTGAFGKWGLGFPGSAGDPNKQGFDEFYGYNCQRIAHHYYPYHLWHNEQKIILQENKGAEKGNYAPISIHKQALSFIEAHQDTSFFLFVPSLIPHAELFAPEEYMEKFRGKFMPEHAYEGVDYGEENFRNGPYGSQPESHVAFAAMVTLLDEQVGDIMNKLDELNLSSNTLVLFSSDNGPHLEGGADPDYFNSNGSFRGYKRDLYEGGIRVPTIAKWPGKIPSGTESDHPSAFWDLAPTLADLLDVEFPKPIDGISFLPTLFNQGEQEKHDYLYWEFHERGGRQALRKNEWKLVLYDINAKTPGKPELYNLTEDPGETTDLSSEFPDKVAELLALMQGARTDSPVFQFSATAYNAER